MSDLIERQAVLNGLASIAKAKARSDAQKAMMGRCMFFVERLPSVSTEKTGRWIKDDKEHGHCSLCGFSGVDLTRPELTNFCSNCGAKMEVEE